MRVIGIGSRISRALPCTELGWLREDTIYTFWNVFSTWPALYTTVWIGSRNNGSSFVRIHRFLSQCYNTCESDVIAETSLTSSEQKIWLNVPTVTSCDSKRRAQRSSGSGNPVSSRESRATIIGKGHYDAMWGSYISQNRYPVCILGYNHCGVRVL